MKFRTDFFKNYLIHAPVPLALERSIECEILSKQQFRKPVLDIGCGEGLFAYILFENKIDVGIDPNQKELDKAAKYNRYDELICCYGDAIPKPDGSFNTIFSNSVMEHIPGIASVLKEAHRLLAADGDMYITIPTNYFDRYSVVNGVLESAGFKKLAERYRKFFNNFWRHYHYYDKKTWEALFNQNGFTVLNSIDYSDKRTTRTNDLLGPFSLWAFLCKKTLNRWFVSPATRFVPARMHYALFNGLLHADVRNFNSGKGAIAFFHLKKKG